MLFYNNGGGYIGKGNPVITTGLPFNVNSQLFYLIYIRIFRQGLICTFCCAV